MKFYMDGDKEFPTICGTGTEDYFGGAWCFSDTFSTAFLGYPLWHQEANQIPKHALYRWHIMDPIRFQKDCGSRSRHWGGGRMESSSHSQMTSRRLPTGIKANRTESFLLCRRLRNAGRDNAACDELKNILCDLQILDIAGRICMD